MIIEVLGVWEHNQGAMLMLEAIREQVAKAFPDARLAVPTSMGAETRARYGLLGVLEGNNKKVRLQRLLPGFLLRSRNLIKPDKVDVILDASGFGYGDYWGVAKLRNRLVERLAKWKRPGRIAILMPQALGPFEASGIGNEFRKALSLLDLAFARDAQSYGYASRCAPAGYALEQAPDFTNALKPELPASLTQWKGYSLVIPNEKMVASGDAAVLSRYLEFLKEAAQRIAASGRPVAILVHEGNQDAGLARQLEALLDFPAPIVVPGSALDTKALISKADLIVSSRFHGLVSALSSGVPALACGWSHKYGALMADYGVERYSVKLDDADASLALLDRFLEEAGDEQFRRGIAQAAEEQRGFTAEMWRKCIQAIRAGAAGGR